MTPDIYTADFDLSDFIRGHVEERLERLFSWHRHRVRNVSVALGDLNGPRGGIDKYCHMTVHLNSGAVIRVEHVADDLYDAISAAARRVHRSVDRVVGRGRASERQTDISEIWREI